jgi:decaprenylphospho-beta-D-erythro-pentofuranosid-2-ulose 2-reductase
VADNPISTALRHQPGAIVIGGSSGIGAALARRLAREGYQVAVLGRRADRLEQVCGQINAEAGQVRARPYPHDVTDYSQAPAAFQAILRDLGQVDVVAYTAGLQMPIGLSEFNFEKDSAMLSVNVLGAMAWLNQAAQYFEQLGSGHIVGISSTAGERGRVANPAYNASKAALNTYLEALRNRLTRKGVHVLTVRPGFVDTDMLRGAKVAKTMWVIPPEQAADDVWGAVRARKQVVFSPARWRWVSLIIRHIPSVIFRRLNF